MATWRCPHCRTVQVESTLCFLCRRSATSCGTCVNFRPSLVGGVGFCVLDRAREPLSGAEQRSCWTGTPAIAVGEPALSVNDLFSRGTVAPAERGLFEIRSDPPAGPGPVSER